MSGPSTASFAHSGNVFFQALPPPRRWVVPGGTRTVMHLARLSLDESARAVAGIWRTLSTESRQRAAVADLVDGANVAGNDVTITSFFRSVHRTGMELGALFPRLPELPFRMLGFKERDGTNPDGSLEIDSREASVRAAWEHALMRDEPFELFLPRCSRKYRRRLNRLLVLSKASDYAARMRRCWRLTQAQFADLFMTDVRSVQRWEAHEVQPTIRHQWFLRLFAQYVKEHGVGTFRRRFVGQRPRYGRRGRPTNAVRSVASSR